jgi:hypothetical protein
MHNLANYPEFNNNPDIQQLIKEGWEFYVEEWVHPHNGDTGEDLKYRKVNSEPAWATWYRWNDHVFSRAEFDRIQNYRKANDILDRFEVQNMCIKSLIENDFKAIHVTIE